MWIILPFTLQRLQHGHLHTGTPILAWKSLDYRMTQPITELESESSFMIGPPPTNQ